MIHISTTTEKREIKGCGAGTVRENYGELRA